MAVNVNAVMDGIGTRLATITGLRVHDYIADSITPPAAMVSLPDVTYDSTMSRGSDDCSVDVIVFVGRASDRASRDQLADYIHGTGSKSIKAAIEGDVTLNGSAQTARVQSATAEVMTVAGNDYLAATFTIEVVA